MRAELSTEAQVTHFQVAVIVNKDVGWLQISMHDSLLVHVLESSSYLMDVLYDSFLLKVDFVLHCLLDHQLKVALLGPLHGNEKFVELAVDEPAQILDDVWVI